MKIALKAVIILALIGLLVAGLQAFETSKANFMPPIEHNSGIFIRSDGSIYPDKVPIQRNGNTYVFTSDFAIGIEVQKSGIVIDGNGYTLTGNKAGTGILLQGVNNVTIQDLKVRNFARGIYFYHSNNSVVKGNMFTGCGIEVTQSSWHNQVVNNTMDSGSIGIGFGNYNVAEQNAVNRISIIFANNTIVKNNHITDEARVDVQLLYYDADREGGILVSNSDNCELYNNTVERKNIGINIWFCENLTLKGNNLLDNQVGFKLEGYGAETNQLSIDITNTVNGKPVYYLVNQRDFSVPNDAGWVVAVHCVNITVKNLISQPNWETIRFVNTRNSSIIGCNLTGNFNAIKLIDSSNCIISENFIHDNGYAALYLEGATNCLITRNDVANNFCLFNIRHDAANNTFYHNNFVGNWTGSFDRDNPNRWDNGKEGNYWSNYTGQDADGDNIGDTPFLVDSNRYSLEADNFPLIKPLELNLTYPTPTQSSTLVPSASLNPTSPLPSISPSASQTPQSTLNVTPSPSLPEFPVWAILILLVAASLIVVIKWRANAK